MKHLWIIKIGGNIINQDDRLAGFLKAFSDIPDPKMLVHGGGRLATDLAQKLEVPVKMVDGRRVTDAAMLEVVTMVYGGLINKTMVARLQAFGSNAIGLTGADGNLIQARKRSGWDLDYGYVGDIEAVNGETLSRLIDIGLTPVLAPLTHDRKGCLLNTNADTIAATVAISMVAYYGVSLVYCFEKPGVLLDPEDEHSLIAELDKKRYRLLKTGASISDGMIPKLDNAFAALDSGVKTVHICQAERVADLQGDQPAGTRLHS